VDELYRRADTDRNGVIAASEARSLAWQGAGALGRSAFQAADGDSDQRLSLEEFQAALQEPARITFNLADTSNDGQLTQQEAAAAMQRLVSQLGTRTASAQ
jgi:Ca2+-binding EF-hand superfamily protein